MTRVRFGLRGVVWFAPNIAIFVGKVDEARFDQIEQQVANLKFILEASGQARWANMLTWERS